MRYLRTCVGIAATLAALGSMSPAAVGEEVNLYSYRQPFLIQPMLDAFTRETGIAVNVVYAKQGVLERLKAEGENSPADAVLTVDIGRISDIAQAGVLQPLRSDMLEANIPGSTAIPTACGSA